MQNKTAHQGAMSALRIIAGRWRGRKIQFSADGIRPTGDRVRETLFNWLAGRVAGARCLDLFAGSGALGFEALSRGAASALFVEKNRRVARQLEQTRASLDCQGATIVTADAWSLSLASHGPFDIVFLDPPFENPKTANLCKLLESSGCLSPDALVYVEVAKSSALPDLPSGFAVLRDNVAGQVRYALLGSNAATDQQE